MPFGTEVPETRAEADKGLVGGQPTLEANVNTIRKCVVFIAWMYAIPIIAGALYLIVSIAKR